MEEGFDAKTMRELAASNNYYRTKIRIAASKGQRQKTFKGNSLIYKELLHELGRLGFSVSAGYTSGGDVEYVYVSW